MMQQKAYLLKKKLYGEINNELNKISYSTLYTFMNDFTVLS